MTLELSANARISRDENGKVRQLSHPTEPFYGTEPGTEAATGRAGPAAAPPSPRALADAYLRAALPEFGIDEALAEGAATALAAPRSAPIDEGQQLHFAEEKVGRDKATVSYAQTHMGLPVWRTGFSVRMRGSPLGVIGASSSVEADLGDVAVPPPDARHMPGRIEAGTLAGLLGLSGAPEITRTRLLVYRYDPEARGNAAMPDHDPDAEAAGEACPHLHLPPVPDSIEAGRYRVVTEVLFRYTAEGYGPLNWRAFLDPATGAALYVDALVSCVDGTVLMRDPLTANGVDTPPNSPTPDLDALRDLVELPEVLDDGTEHRLEGRFVRVANVSPPNHQPPTSPIGQDFSASVPTDDFAAINGYYHSDRCFRLVEELGFDVADYFDGTSFPVIVDHRATIGGQTQTVNAQAPGNNTGDGSDGFRFALLAPNATIGMAAEQRVTWHEFGHAVLWDHLDSPNFRFAHSPGDTFAAILLDPETQAPDPGRTFPWTIIARRHDHAPASGFAWGGTRDSTFPVGTPFSPDAAGYQREQILSSTLFRLYRSAGGGSADLATRQNASRRTMWLILETIASLSPFAEPRNAEDLWAAMTEADLLATAPVEPRVAGLLPKVLRWAFERQGLFQPAGAPSPVTGPGAPPAVDVFIDDGRAGEYDEAPDEISEPPGLVVRRAADDGAIHEDPAEGEEAFVYLTVQNRGQDTAQGVRASVAVRRAADGPDWSGDWDDLDARDGAGYPFDVAPGASVTVGPFAWTPATGGDWLVFADVDCPDDRSVVRSTLQGDCAASTVAMMDNNAAFRLTTVTPAVG